MSSSLQPIFDRVTSSERNDYNRFFEYTSPENIQHYAQGRSLTYLVSLAEKTTYVIGHCNPIWDTWDGGQTDAATAIRARQWQLDRISEVKVRLAEAIPLKRSYYENHFFGTITKFVLQCFGLWYNGDTASIVTAEDFLLSWDTRARLIRDHVPNQSMIASIFANFTDSQRRYESTLFFFPLIWLEWVHQNLDTSNFYNYTPSRTLEIRTSSTSQRNNLIDIPSNFVWV